MMKRFFIWRRTAGAVVFHLGKTGQIEYLILKHKSYWNFPKGGVEKGESDVRAARREIKEETGLVDIKFIPGFNVRRNLFYRGAKNSRKAEYRGRVIFRRSILLLAQSASKRVKISEEHFGFAWLDFKEAEKRLAILGNNHKVLVRADKFLRGYLTKRKK